MLTSPDFSVRWWLFYNFSLQKEAGGIIDIDAESKKFLIVTTSSADVQEGQPQAAAAWYEPQLDSQPSDSGKQSDPSKPKHKGGSGLGKRRDYGDKKRNGRRRNWHPVFCLFPVFRRFRTLPPPQTFVFKFSFLKLQLKSILILSKVVDRWHTVTRHFSFLTKICQTFLLVDVTPYNPALDLS